LIYSNNVIYSIIDSKSMWNNKQTFSFNHNHEIKILKSISNFYSKIFDREIILTYSTVFCI
jgi:hypothetical protein